MTYQKKDFIIELLEIAEDVKRVYSSYTRNKQRFLNRTYMHFSGAHYNNLLKDSHHKQTKKALKMY